MKRLSGLERLVTVDRLPKECSNAPAHDERGGESRSPLKCLEPDVKKTTRALR